MLVNSKCTEASRFMNELKAYPEVDQMNEGDCLLIALCGHPSIHSYLMITLHS